MNSEFDARIREITARQQALAFALGKLAARVDKLRDDARMLRLMVETERDIREAQP